MKPFWGRVQKVRLGSKDLWKSKEDSKGEGGGFLIFMAFRNDPSKSRTERRGVKFSSLERTT